MIGLLLRIALDVRIASYTGAALAGSPELGPWASCVAWRESRHELIRIHADDAWMQRRLGAGWSTRGAHGQVAAYSWPHVPAWLRWTPAILDIPVISAYVATRRARARSCRHPACASWRRCGNHPFSWR